jgi:ubiquinone/menaquinone biosynthesis C-methylase UbiE
MVGDPTSLLRANGILWEYRASIFESPEARRRRFLDLSCGTRTDIRRIAEAHGYEWVGTDIFVHPMVMVTGDAHVLPFREGVFDVVYSAGAFEHYHDPWEAAREVRRVLKPGGWFCGSIAFLQPWHQDSYYHFTHLGVLHMLKKAAFDVADCRPAGEHGLRYLIKMMFPKPAPRVVGGVLSLYVDFLTALRRVTAAISIYLCYMGNPVVKKEKLASMRMDAYRYPSSIQFLARKPSVS